MSENNAPQTPWATEPDKRGPLRAALILGVIAVVLLAVLGGCALLGRDSGKDKTKGPTKSADQIAAEKVAKRVAVAEEANDPAYCDDTTKTQWRAKGAGGMLNDHPDLKTCQRYFEDETDHGTASIKSVRSVDLRPAADAWGVELVYTDSDGDQVDRAYKVISDDGVWKVDRDELVDDDARALATQYGVDPIAAALKIDTREGAQ